MVQRASRMAWLCRGEWIGDLFEAFGGAGPLVTETADQRHLKLLNIVDERTREAGTGVAPPDGHAQKHTRRSIVSMIL